MLEERSTSRQKGCYPSYALGNREGHYGDYNRHSKGQQMKLCRDDARMGETMRGRIMAALRGEVPLDVIVADVDFILTSMKHKPPKVRERWETLEEILASRAYALEEGRALPHDDQPDVVHALDEMLAELNEFECQ